MSLKSINSWVYSTKRKVVKLYWFLLLTWTVFMYRSIMSVKCSFTIFDSFILHDYSYLNLTLSSDLRKYGCSSLPLLLSPAFYICENQWKTLDLFSPISNNRMWNPILPLFRLLLLIKPFFLYSLIRFFLEIDFSFLAVICSSKYSRW